MRLVIEIPDGYDLTMIQNGSIASKQILNAVKNGIPINPQETVTEFADRCRECGKQKRGHWILTDAEEEIYCHVAICSVCGRESINEGVDEYCSCCGARMEV